MTMTESGIHTEQTTLQEEQRRTIEEIQAVLSGHREGDMEELLWKALCLFEGHPFQTAKGLQFSYQIRGYEMFVDRKEKSITRSTVNVALKKALELGKEATGPKKLGVFGASYLYPVFEQMRIVQRQK